ncbi:hypothetical protein [Acetivibrio saccincola]|uniref:hypothetical protein n=1 Tax=Acetivibrio saccincola TaxID=1677857 RepID=UPI00131B70D7|nr:hypothetical protein [Acetivibrio saccincola]
MAIINTKTIIPTRIPEDIRSFLFFAELENPAQCLMIRKIWHSTKKAMPKNKLSKAKEISAAEIIKYDILSKVASFLLMLSLPIKNTMTVHKNGISLFKNHV